MAFGMNCNVINKDMILKQLPNNPFMQAFFRKAQLLSKRKVKGLCEVIFGLNGRFYPCYVGKNFVIFGQMYGKGKSISQQMMQKLKAREDKKQKKEFLSKKKQIERLVAIEYRPSKSARRTLYMFTDPLCPFCHKAENKIKNLVKKYNVDLKILFYSVHPPRGIKKAVEAICRGFDLDKYLSEGWRKEKDIQKYQCAKGKELVQKSSDFARSIGISGVPTFIFDDGTRVVGARIFDLERILKEKTKR
jgi:thiol:disulfide interchange protein DsbC